MASVCVYVCDEKREQMYKIGKKIKKKKHMILEN